ncbi:MAG: hypothetical protein QN193_07020 [Armatimonadota bacterium]|nr:hypothetical protein [Armatimonadota bacterium]MDR7443508.1 hypothetical protein [Armatimonadota bacterium]MDR7570341.1 hypothetical protein [Armatimonadota bacterium]MDR7615007.1 hypothetical protein [Armatimonadota bacterium]
MGDSKEMRQSGPWVVRGLRWVALPALATLFLVLGGAAVAGAVPVLDFNMDATHPAGASISYAGGTNPLVGINISVDNVTGLGTPLNSGITLTIVGGILNFTTGNLIGSTSTSWLFGGGGSITLVGKIPDLGINTLTTLLSGTWTSASVFKIGDTFRIVGGTFVDTKLKALTDYFGLPDGVTLYLGNINLSFSATGSPPNAFSSTRVLSGDLLNTPRVPEPSAGLLFASALASALGAVSLGSLRRKGTPACAAA